MFFFFSVSQNCDEKETVVKQWRTEEMVASADVTRRDWQISLYKEGKLFVSLVDWPQWVNKQWSLFTTEEPKFHNEKNLLSPLKYWGSNVTFIPIGDQ